jgi:hypothetical protein
MKINPTSTGHVVSTYLPNFTTFFNCSLSFSYFYFVSTTYDIKVRERKKGLLRVVIYRALRVTHHTCALYDIRS